MSVGQFSASVSATATVTKMAWKTGIPRPWSTVPPAAFFASRPSSAVRPMVLIAMHPATKQRSTAMHAHVTTAPTTTRHSRRPRGKKSAGLPVTGDGILTPLNCGRTSSVASKPTEPHSSASSRSWRFQYSVTSTPQSTTTSA